MLSLRLAVCVHCIIRSGSCSNTTIFLIHEVAQITSIRIAAKKRQSPGNHRLQRYQHCMPISSYRARLSTPQKSCQLNTKSTHKPLQINTSTSRKHTFLRPHFRLHWSTTQSNLQRKNETGENVNGWIRSGNKKAGYTAGEDTHDNFPGWTSKKIYLYLKTNQNTKTQINKYNFFLQSNNFLSI